MARGRTRPTRSLPSTCLTRNSGFTRANVTPTRGVSALEGIRQMRDQLREARSVVRLVGLSGVGKTRLVQALFDDRVGVQSLNPSLAIYTNMADSPDPQPIGLASDLVAAGTPAILVIDNCPPELHQRLSEVCRQERSKLSVITVEYDIREDEPEGTEVFTLETSSSELIEKLLRQALARHLTNRRTHDRGVFRRQRAHRDRARSNNRTQWNCRRLDRRSAVPAALSSTTCARRITLPCRAGMLAGVLVRGRRCLSRPMRLSSSASAR